MNSADNGEKKFLNSDTRLLAIFVVFAVLTIGYVLTQILGLGNPVSLSVLLAAVACITLSSLILGALEVVKHLRRNTHEVYREDLACSGLRGTRRRQPLRQLLVMTFDISFILILCFLILLVTMLVNKGLHTGAAQGYTVNPYMLCAVAAALALYQYFMTHASCSALSKMFKDNSADSERQTGGREE